MANQRKIYRELTVSEICGYNYNRIPSIRIQGKWLAELGFMPGDAVLVRCDDGKIIITRDEAMIEKKAAGEAFLAEERKKLETQIKEKRKLLNSQLVAEQEARYEAL